MARIELLTVPDEGEGELVRSALTEAGISVEVERAYTERAFSAQVFAELSRILVPEEQLVGCSTD